MAPSAPVTKQAALTKKPEKEKKKSATPYRDNLREQGIKPDILDYPAMAWEATSNAVSKVITKMKPKKKEAESHPEPRLKDKGKRE